MFIFLSCMIDRMYPYAWVFLAWMNVPSFYFSSHKFITELYYFVGNNKDCPLLELILLVIVAVA